MEASNSKFTERRAFIVGINSYKYLSELETPINDCEALKDLLIGKFGYKEAAVKVCYNPDKKRLLDFLKEMKKMVNEDDSVLFYFAGHGIAKDEEKGLKGFLLTTDSDLNKNKNLVPMQLLYDGFSDLPCRHFLLVLDCCFSGAFRWAQKPKGGYSRTRRRMSRQHYEHYTSHPAWHVITSATHTQISHDILEGRPNNGKPLSPFAEFMLTGLSGRADWNNDKIITASELSTYLVGQLKKIQNVVFFPLPKHGNGEFIFQPSEFSEQELKERDYDNPYMGLETYTKSNLFFGREDATKKLLALVKNNKLTIVIGASGTGKSSLVKAGVIPKLQREGKKIEEMRPGKYPRSRLKKISSCDVLVIDQFEEVITQSVEEEATAFMGLLKSKVAEGQLTIIITLRIDFESQIDIDGIGAQWKDGRFLAPPFTPENLRDIIVSPAARVGRFIESDSLVDDIISEVMQYPGSLPLLSFTLSELFEKCKKIGLYRGIQESDYKELGGISGALQNVADKVFAEMDDSGKKLLKKLMLRMVSLLGGEIAGKRVMKEDLPYDPTRKLDTIIKKLIEVRLVRSDSDLNNNKIYYEPTHDALVRSWGQLSGWIKSFGEDNIFLLQKLSVAVEDYLKKGDEDHLWHRNANLEPALTLKGKEEGLFNLKELDFLRKSKEKKVNEIEALKAERDEAVRQKELAEKRLRAVENTSLSLQKYKTDPTLALRIASYNRENNVGSTMAEYHDFISDTLQVFYSRCFQAHNESIQSIDISPDGNKILTCASDNTVKLWSLKGDLFFTVNIEKTIFEALFSPTGETFLIVGKHALSIYSSEGKYLSTVVKKSNSYIITAAFSPNGQTILIGNGGDYAAELWSLDGRLLTRYEKNKNEVLSVAFSPDGNSLLTSNGKEANLWSLEADILATFVHDHYIESVAFSPDGQMVLTGGQDAAKLWSLTGNLISNFEADYRGLEKVAFSPNNKLILTTEGDGRIRIWSIDGKLISYLLGHTWVVSSAVFSPDSEKIISCSWDKTVRTWFVNRSLVNSFEINDSGINIISFLKGNLAMVIGSSYKNLRIFSLNGVLLSEILNTESYTYFDIAFSKNKESVLILSNDKIIRYNIKSGRLINSIRHNQNTTTMAFSPDKRYVVSGDKEGFVSILDANGNFLFKFKAHDEYISAVSFSSDGNKIITGGFDNTARIWTNKGRIISTLYGHTRKVMSVRFSPNDEFILTSSEDNTAILWSLDGLHLVSFKGHTKGLISACFSHDGKKVLTISRYDDIKLWSINGKILKTYYTGRANSAVFDSNDQIILAGLYKSVKIWMTDQSFLEKRVHKFSLTYLYRFGVQLEPHDLQTLWEQSVQLTPEELRLIGKSENLPSPNA